METRGLQPIDRWSTLQAITHEDLRGFYDTYYVPESMTLTVIGDINRAEALAVAERSFGELPRRPVPSREIPIRDPGPQEGDLHLGLPARRPLHGALQVLPRRRRG